MSMPSSDRSNEQSVRFVFTVQGKELRYPFDMNYCFLKLHRQVQAYHKREAVMKIELPRNSPIFEQEAPTKG
jgi:hypothetical protein